MDEKTFFKIATAWTVIVFLVNVIYVPYLIITTTGGSQAPFTFIAKSILVWGVFGGIILFIHLLARKK